MKDYQLQKLLDKQKRIYAQLKRKGECELNKKCVAKGSKIAGYGVFALKDIEKDEKIIEYKGELIDKEESDERGEGLTGDEGIYIFTLNEEYDIDGSVGGNGAQLLNHSCSPNCEAVNEDDHIWITAIKDIKKGEELVYDYGYDTDDYEDHPCKCGSENCIGFIIGRDHWKEKGFGK